MGVVNHVESSHFSEDGSCVEYGQIEGTYAVWPPRNRNYNEISGKVTVSQQTINSDSIFKINIVLQLKSGKFMI